jgi:hypothetical protein
MKRWMLTSSGRLLEADFTTAEELELDLGRYVATRGRITVHEDADADRVLAERLAAVEGEIAEIRARNYPREDEL